MSEQGDQVAAPPRAESNGLGLAGFVISLVGLCSGGVLSPIGLILSLVALGRRPRGFAVAGVILGLLGSCGIVAAIVIGILAPALLLGAAATAGIAGMLGPHFDAVIEMGRLNGEIAAYEDRTGALPLKLDDLSVSDPELLTDPWGNTYSYVLAPNGLSYTIHSMGPDGVDGTGDDVEVEPDFELHINSP